jgi:hypothetical protein
VRTWSLRKRGSALLLLALLVSAPLAVAAEGEPTREEYVAQVDLICKKNEKSNSRILKGVRQQIAKQHQFIPAGKRFLKAAKSFGRAVTEIVGVPQPSADEAKLKKWIGYLHLERSQLQRIGQALKRKLGGKANHLAVQLHQTNRKANNTVFSFEFQYCDREANFG